MVLRASLLCAAGGVTRRDLWRHLMSHPGSSDLLTPAEHQESVASCRNPGGADRSHDFLSTMGQLVMPQCVSPLFIDCESGLLHDHLPIADSSCRTSDRSSIT